MQKTEQVTNKKEFKQDMRKFVFTCNAYLIILIVVALAIIVNLLAARFSFRFDTTKNKLYSLSGQSIETIKTFDKQKNDLKIYAFFRQGDQNANMVEDLLKEYKKRSSRIDYKFIDPYKNPSQAKQYQIQELNTLVLVSGAQELKILPNDMFQQGLYGEPPRFTGEQALTRTINKLISADTKTIYFLEGHGKKEYSSATTYITGEGYKIQYVDLMKQGKIPDDCAQLIIAGPQTDLLSQEVKIIDDYMSKGGRLMIFLDYQPKKAFIPNLVKFMQNWGVGVEDCAVVELSRSTIFDITAVIPYYLGHPITSKLQENNINVILPFNRALVKLDDYKGDAVVTTIMQSSDNSWAESNPSGQVKRDASETKGPIPLGIVASRTFTDSGEAKESRLIVLGTSSFLDNNFVNQAGNLNLFYNMTQWLLGQEDRISITAKQVDMTMVTLTPVQGNIIRIMVLIILPLVILSTGGWIWYRRRAR